MIGGARVGRLAVKANPAVATSSETHPGFLSILTGSFATPAAENPTAAMTEAAYRHHGIDARYISARSTPRKRLVLGEG